MKVYFDATPSQIDKYRKNYQAIGKIIERLGHEHTSRWILDFDESFYSLPPDKWRDHYKKIISDLNRADVAVVEISVSSTSVGQLIQLALMWKKPVIALKDYKGPPNFFLVGAGEVESKLLVVEYSLDRLEGQLKEALEYVEDWLECRFTLIINSKIKRYLDKVAKTGTSRSEYIRELIEMEIKKER